MPTYQYVCANPEGKHEFEVVQSFSDAPVSECAECGSPVRKVYGSVGVVFKGSGFYRTDSRSGASKGSNGSSTESSAKDSPSAKDSAKGSSTGNKAGGGSSSSASSSSSGTSKAAS